MPGTYTASSIAWKFSDNSILAAEELSTPFIVKGQAGSIYGTKDEPVLFLQTGVSDINAELISSPEIGNIHEGGAIMLGCRSAGYSYGSVKLHECEVIGFS